jgi:hypothetical protein
MSEPGGRTKSLPIKGAAILLNILMNNFIRFALFLLYLISLIEIVQDIKIN